MDISKVLWVDLRSVKDEIGASHYLSEVCAVSHISNSTRLDLDICKTQPALLCFEYDYPDHSGLSALRQARNQFPSLPIIMITEQHSEALATWALRIHIWDYFVKPFNPRDLLTSAATIVASKISPGNESAQQYQLFNPLPAEFRVQICHKKKTYAARFFVESHYHKRISEKEVAKLCSMNTSTFSRRFKKEHEINFRDYLISYRINKARGLLQNPDASVTDVAYTVGFRDPSYFTRAFRRIVGESPSSYRKVYKTH